MTTPAQDGADWHNLIQRLKFHAQTSHARKKNCVPLTAIWRRHHDMSLDLDAAAALITSLSQAVAAERKACAALCDQWVTLCQDFDIKYTSARNYAVEAVKDIAAAIRAREGQG